MDHEDGYCDSCGAEIPDGAETWLTLDGAAHCKPCAIASGAVVIAAKRPEARDDGR